MSLQGGLRTRPTPKSIARKVGFPERRMSNIRNLVQQIEP